VNVDNAQKQARKRLPASVYDFIVGDTEDELTTAGNRQAFKDLTFRPRSGVIYPDRNLKVTVMGSELSMPVALAPAGALRLARRHAYIHAARAAGNAGTAMGVSTVSTDDIFDICKATKGPVWYQIYQAGGPQAVDVAIERAKRAGCTALFVTMDTAAAGFRDNQHIGTPIPLRMTFKDALRFVPQCSIKPAWTWDYIREGLDFKVPNIRQSIDGPPMDFADSSIYKTPPTWEDFARIRKLWDGPLCAKGILTPEDARIALNLGADAVVVSNHGGFQMDSAPATLKMLPAIADAVGDKMEVLLDSGVRRGQDVVKALALGAKAVLIGRAYVWPLAARGEAGVDEILERFRHEIDRVLRNLGVDDVSKVDRSYVNWSPSNH
jgi:isopentenyl diphosphate isomerase/L-lactate dehydrogenase-like FMN-dependent dehydrogenase